MPINEEQPLSMMPSVEGPKKQIKRLVYEEIHETLKKDNADFDFSDRHILGSDLAFDIHELYALDLNLSYALGKDLDLTFSVPNYPRLNVAQLVEVVFAKANDLPVPDFRPVPLAKRLSPIFNRLFRRKEKVKN